MMNAQQFFLENDIDIIDIRKMSGKWYIQKTSINFWLNRFSPTVTYTIEKNSPEIKILDRVRYINSCGKTKEVIGYDSLRTDINGQFRWQAKSWYLRFLKSEWGIVAHDEEYNDWAVTYFSKTAFTPEGMDIYSRSKVLTNNKYQEILQTISDMCFLKPYIDQLYQTKKC